MKTHITRYSRHEAITIPEQLNGGPEWNQCELMPQSSLRTWENCRDSQKTAKAFILIYKLCTFRWHQQQTNFQWANFHPTNQLSVYKGRPLKAVLIAFN